MATIKRVGQPARKPPPQTTNESRGGNEDTQFYRQARWIKLRASILRGEPLCRHCKEKDRLEPATMVDHIVPVKQGGEKYERDNLQPLCDKCHARKSSKERNRKGGGTQ